MYNPNVLNINEVGHYKKINVTELRQMPEEELIRFFVDMSGGEFEEQKKKMTKEELKEVTEFINSIPKYTFNKIEQETCNKIENKCLKLFQKCDEIYNIIDYEVESITTFINGVSECIDSL